MLTKIISPATIGMCLWFTITVAGFPNLNSSLYARKVCCLETLTFLVWFYFVLRRVNCNQRRCIYMFISLFTHTLGCFSCVWSYGVLFWGNSPHSPIIFKMQKRLLRILVGVGYRDSCRELFKEQKNTYTHITVHFLIATVCYSK